MQEESRTDGERIYRVKAGSLGRELAQDIIRDERISRLTMEGLGGLIYLMALNESGMRVPFDPVLGAKKMGVGVRKFTSILAQLTDSNTPLIQVDEDGFIQVQKFGLKVPRKLSNIRSDAAKQRWDKAKIKELQDAEQINFLSQQVKGLSDAVELKRAVRKKPKSDPIPTIEKQKQAFENAMTAQVDAEQLMTQVGIKQEVKTDDLFNPVPIQNPEKAPMETLGGLFIQICKSYSEPISHKKWSTKRRKLVESRWGENPNIDIWKKLFEKAEESDFLAGRTKNTWKASFDWLINADNFIKTLEGNYDNSKGYRGGPEFSTKGAVASDKSAYGSHELHADQASWMVD